MRAVTPEKVASYAPSRTNTSQHQGLQDGSPSVEISSQGGTPTESVKSRPNLLQYLSKVQWFIIDQWFLIGLGVLVAISSQVQVPASGQDMKEVVVTYLCVSIIFFITGCTLSTKILVENYARWKLHLFVQVESFLVTSATTFAIVSACATNRDFMDPALLIGMIFLGCVPTTISSNVVMTRQAHGNVALTVVQSTIGNFLGPFLTPPLISMYTLNGAWYTSILPQESGGYSEIYKRVFKQLGLSVFVPMAIGQIVQNVFPKPTKKVFTEWKLSKIGSVCLLIIIWQTYDSAFAVQAFTSVNGSNMVFIVFISIAYYVLWLAISFTTSVLWLSKKDTIAVVYCVPAKTPAMGVPLSSVMFIGLSALNKSKIQLPLVIFQGLQIAFSSVLTIVFKNWVRPDEEREEAEKKQIANEDTHG